MANDKDIRIGIQTTADTSGFTKTDEAAKKLNGTLSVSTVDQFLDSSASKAQVAEFAFYDLDKAMKGGTGSAEKFAAGATEVKKSTTDASRSLLLFSQGFEDAQYGIRGVLNNIPQLVVSLGGGAGLAGAISIAAVSFSVLYEWFGKTEEKASDVADRIKQTADNIGSLNEEKLTDFRTELTDTTANALTLKESLENNSTASNDYTLTALSNAAKLKIAEANVNELLGKRIEKLKEIEQAAAAEQARRDAETKKAIAAEEEKARKAQEAVTNKADVLTDLITAKDLAAADLVIANQKLEALRKQKVELEKIKDAANPFPNSLEQAFTESQRDYNTRIQAGRDASQKLADPNFQAELQGLQKTVDQLRETLRGDTRTISNTSVQLEALKNVAAKTQEDVDTNITALRETQAADTSVAKTGDAVAQAKEFATQLTNVVNQLQPTLATGIAAKDDILQITKDQIVTQDEMGRLARDLVTITGQLQSGVIKVNGNMATLGEAIRELQTGQTKLEGLFKQFTGQ